jgi:hypothetical protein
MGVRGSLATAVRGGRLLAGGVFLLASLGVAAPGYAAGGVTLQATYMIAISGLSIGRADVKARFTDRGYAAAISGSTYGVSRIVSDARATLAGSGRISGNSVMPASYNLETSESGFQTSVSMTMRGGAIVGLQAIPNLPQAADRVPMTAQSRQNVLDPVGAFVVAMDKPGDPDPNRACNRVVKVFDGWKRFDIHLSYKETRPASGGDGDAKVIVCAARYVPVAGHRSGDESVAFMADNKRLEISLSPIEGTRYLVPTRILIGTQVGDLTISARTFGVTPGEQQASAN